MLPSDSILKTRICSVTTAFDFKTLFFSLFKMQSLQSRGAKHTMICVLNKKNAHLFSDNGGPNVKRKRGRENIERF